MTAQDQQRAAMPANKSQHYVPRFMLREFSSDTEKRAVALINIKSRRFIPQATISTQCAKDYFYGKDLAVEKMLSKIEGAASSIIMQLISSPSMLPKFRTDLATFIALQRHRTLHAYEEESAIGTKMARLALKGSFSDEEIRGFGLHLERLPAEAIRMAVHESPALWDLKQVLLVNETPIPLVIGDDPVAFTNWFYKRRFKGLGKQGFSSAGLQVYTPITPRRGLLLHDSDTYSMKSPDQPIRLQDLTSVRNLNEVQWFNSHKNVYVPPGLPSTEVDRLTSLANPPERQYFHRAEETEISGRFMRTDKDEFAPFKEGTGSELVVFGSKPAPVDIQVYGVALRKNARFYQAVRGLGPIRDPAWSQITYEFGELLHQGRVTLPDIFAFVLRHPLGPSVGKWFDRLLESYGQPRVRLRKPRAAPIPR